MKICFWCHKEIEEENLYVELQKEKYAHLCCQIAAEESGTLVERKLDV